MTDWHCCMPGHPWGDDGVCIRCGAYEPEKRSDPAAAQRRSSCDVCGADDRPTVTVIAYGIETNACDKCRGEQ